VATIHLEQILFKLRCIGQIAVVNKGDSIGSVHIKGLHLFFCSCSSSRGITNMANSDIAEKLAHISCSERFSNPAPLLMHMECVIVHRDNPRRVLPTVLKQ